mgnify:CR=1 FL=1
MVEPYRATVQPHQAGTAQVELETREERSVRATTAHHEGAELEETGRQTVAVQSESME